MLELTLKQKHRQSLNELETASKRFGHGSVEPMCFKLGLNNPRSLSNKTNADFDNAHMAWHEAWEVVSATCDLTPVRTELAALGLTTAPLPALSNDGIDKEVYLREMLKKFSKVVHLNDEAQEEHSEYGRAYSKREKQEIKQSGLELAAAIMGFIASIE